MARHGSFRSDTGSYQDEAFRSVERLEPKTYTVPETRDLLPPKQQDTPDKQQQSSSSGSDNPSSSKRGLRFRKKTPKISTGLASAFPRPPNALKRTSSVELIAAQYHAMSESRHSSRYSDEFQQFKLSLTESDTKEQIMTQRPQRSVYHAQDYDVDDSAHVYVETPSTAGLPGPSPISDDGTLVSFQDDTVYFKPFSSAPKSDPVSPPTAAEANLELMGVDDKTEDNLGLQICLDLLTRELSSATSYPSFTSSPHSPDSGTSTLQVWTMIEAYERLRDKMAGMNGTNGRARSMEKMFDSWLGALYSVHGSLKKNGGEFVGARDGRRSGDNGIKQRLERSEKHRGMRGGQK
ncbi:uncharacterized protein C8A04DRAFT_9047 [Dichotomopilus funicola]|uniref:Uncharacterized protein n=1 Tax=Dichotomopilus funicola TaxID=1934379 RepID=A0AAN6V9Y2_9PEZI|nr:hypothetical protein C8A04DRAFT_9047 [Dichotomopilus funicola]